jgi:hypothetical protein
MFPPRLPAGRPRPGIEACLVLLALGGCFDPTFQDPICGEGEECPSGYSCANGVGQVCVAGTPPDGGPGPGEPDAAPITCDESQRRWVQLLANPGFEGGEAGWTTEAGFDVIRMFGDGLPVAPREGDWAAIIGERDADQLVSQVVTVPGGISRVRFGGHGCFATNETAATPIDRLSVRLVPTNDPTRSLAELADFSNVNAAASCRWDTFEKVVEMVSLPDKAELRIHADLDSARVTTFYLDGLHLDVFACPGALTGGGER